MARLRRDPYFRRDVKLSLDLGVPLSVYLGAPRDSPFTDADRDALAAWYADQEERCPQCKQPRELCSNPRTLLYPQRHICYVTAAEERSRRLRARVTEGAKPDRNGYLPTDGELIWVSAEDLTPDDDFLNGR